MGAVDRVASSQRHVAGRQGLSAVLVQYDRRRYPGALQRLRTHLELLARESWSLVAVDNAAPGSWESELARGVTQVGGDNSAWEFSGFDRGLAWLEDTRGLTDFVLLVTDAFRAYGEDYLGWFDQTLLDTARRNHAAIGWVDSFGHPCTFYGKSYESWLRTSFLLVPSSALQRARPLALPLTREDIFSGDPEAPWRSDSPVGPELRQAIEGWLIEGRAEAAGLAEGWHSRFSLDDQSLDFFERKAMAILREHHLSLKLRAAGVHCFDLRLAGVRSLQSPLVVLGPQEEWLSGLEIYSRSLPPAPGAESPLAERPLAESLSLESPSVGSPGVERSPGPRILVDGLSWTPERVGFVRWFVLEVAPLLRQREPSFTVEIAGSEAPSPVRVLVASELARWSEEHASPALLRVVPQGSGKAASERGWETLVLEAEWRIPGKRGRAAVDLAQRILPELRRALADPASWAPAGDAVEAGSGEVVVAPPPLEATTLRSSAEYRRWQRVEADEAKRRGAYEHSLVKSSEPFLVPAWCYACRRQTGQHVDFEYCGSVESLRPNWRERLVCQNCGLNAKSRAVLHVLAEVVVPAPEARVLVCEDRSGLAEVLPVAWPGAVVVDSFRELGEAEDLGQIDPSLRAPVDSLLVLDVFATVNDLDEAARVCERLVAPGGALLFTAPFRTDRERTVETDGEDGVHRELGWDVLETFSEAGFEDVAAQFLWSIEFGYLGGTVVVFTARKGSAGA